MAGRERDPLSEHYDATARRALHLAIIARRAGRPASLFVVSPGREFSRTDRGGRTAHERAFTRAIYYLAWRVPINRGVAPDWSVKLTWGPIERHGSRYGRRVEVRAFTRDSGARHVRTGKVRSWAAGETFRSGPVRIDEAG